MSVQETYAISLNEVVIKRGARTVIHGLTLRIPCGMVYALLGGNGAGKTTTLNTLLGFLKPHSGSVEIDGIDIWQSDIERPPVAYLPENVSLYPYMTGIENLRYFCMLAGVALTPLEASERLNESGLHGQFHGVRVDAYSKGMRQKVGLSIAHARHASAMLLDEPTSGLDPSAANDFAQRIRQASKEGMAVLMATHDLFNVKQVADRIGIMKAGHLIEEFDATSVTHEELESKYLFHMRESIDTCSSL